MYVYINTHTLYLYFTIIRLINIVIMNFSSSLNALIENYLKKFWMVLMNLLKYEKYIYGKRVY